MTTRCILALGFTLLGLAGPALAERPTGLAVRLNATTAGDQRLTDLAVAADGRFAAVWWSRTSATAPWRIVARVFNSNLSPRTGEIAVATVPNDVSAFTGRVAMERATGDFVVVWSTHDATGLPTGLFVRRFRASGASLGPTLALGAGRGFPDVARVGPRFVVVWQQLDAGSTPGAPSYDVVGRRFSATGAPIGGIFPVGVTGDSQERPAIAMNAAGRFAVAFEHEEDIILGSWSALAALVLPPRRLPVAGPDEGAEVVFTNDGQIFVQWTNDGIDPPDEFGHGFGVLGIILREDGEVSGFGRINSFRDGIQASLTAAVKGDGGFLAGWISFTQDGSGTGVYGRQLGPSVTGPEFRVNRATAGNQLDLEFGTFGDGRGVAAYSTPQTGFDVVARRLVP